MPKSTLPPGPRSPAAWQLLHYSQSPLPFLENCAARYGDPFTVRLAGYGKFVMLSSPDAVRDVFRAEPHALHSGEGNEFLSITAGTNSVLVLDDEPHLRQRRLLLPPLKGERMRDFFDAMRSATQTELSTWPHDRPIRMLEPMQNITLSVMSQVVFGLSPGPQLAEFGRLVSRVLAFGRHRYALIGAKLVPSRLFQRARFLPFFRQLHELDDAIFAFIESRRHEPADRRISSVLSDLLAVGQEDGATLTDREIRDALVTLLIAGHDTTALALAWALEQIVPRAEVTQRIRTELQEVTGGNELRVEHLDRLDYLDAAIRESLRLRTIFPFVVRLTKQPFTAAGREYPTGVVLCPCNHLVHRRPDLYPDPQAFRPERFLERHFAGHEFFPFGGGIRACLGMAFAMFEMKIVLAELLTRLRLDRPPGAYPKAVRRGVALAPHDGTILVASTK